VFAVLELPPAADGNNDLPELAKSPPEDGAVDVKALPWPVGAEPNREGAAPEVVGVLELPNSPPPEAVPAGADDVVGPPPKRPPVCVLLALAPPNGPPSPLPPVVD